MQIVSLTTENANGRRFITVRAMMGEREPLEAENMTVLQDLINEADERLGVSASDAKDDAGEDEKPKGRGRGRPRGSTKAKAEEPEDEPEEAPVRRRGRAAPEPEEDEISDADLVKACSDAVEKCKAMAKLIPVILAEDFGVKSTEKLPQDKRQEFIDAVESEIEAQLADD